MLPRLRLFPSRFSRRFISTYPDFLSSSPPTTPVEALDRRLASQGILLEDALLVHPLSTLLTLEPSSFPHLYTDLYGDETSHTLPVLLPHWQSTTSTTTTTVPDDDPSPMERRQFLVERLSQRLAMHDLIEHRKNIANFASPSLTTSGRRPAGTLRSADLIRTWRHSLRQDLLTSPQVTKQFVIAEEDCQLLASLTVHTVVAQLCAPKHLRTYNTPGLEDKIERQERSDSARLQNLTNPNVVADAAVTNVVVNEVVASVVVNEVVEGEEKKGIVFGGLCDEVGTAVNAHMNARVVAGKKGVVWSTAERVKIGAELVKRLMNIAKVDLTEDQLKLDFTVSNDVGNLTSMSSSMSSSVNSSSSSSCSSSSDELGEGYIDVARSDDRVSLFPVESTTVATTTVPALLHRIVRSRDGKTTGMVYLRASVAADLQKEGNVLTDMMVETFTRHLPMLMKPRPWSGLWEGPYVVHRVPLIRAVVFKKHKQDIEDGKEGAERLMKIMDGLGGVGWRVNKEVLNVVEDIWKLKCNQSLGHQQSATASSLVLPNPHDYITPKNVSTLATFKIKLKLAQSLQHAPVFYFPHNFDFRGRTYPTTPLLNPQSDDLARSLLTFSEAKPLGVSGFRWLQVHTANLFGQDKASLDERVAWCEANMPMIRMIAKEPLKEPGWSKWTSLDDPWQGLAACFELNAALEAGVEIFESRLCVYQDGSCNGLQHYAALGRDKDGAKSVNLVAAVASAAVVHDERMSPSNAQGTFVGEGGPAVNRVQDVYTEVLTRVKRRVEADSVSPRTDAATVALAEEALVVLQRKVVKQTVMTLAYGVTFMGAKDQINAALEDKVQDREKRRQLSVYIAKKVFESIEELFERAMMIKKYLDQCSKVLTSEGIGVQWVTPLGFVCRQPYKNDRVVSVDTGIQLVSVAVDDEEAPINKRRHRMGFPPNFVHSLDASHLLLTVERFCIQRGRSFAAVHDSYWTHAADVAEMNAVLRDAFVEIHQRPLLEELHEQFRVMLGSKDHLLPDVPMLGELDIEQVRNSPYFFD